MWLCAETEEGEVVCGKATTFDKKSCTGYNKETKWTNFHVITEAPPEWYEAAVAFAALRGIFVKNIMLVDKRGKVYDNINQLPR